VLTLIDANTICNIIIATFSGSNGPTGKKDQGYRVLL